LMSLCCFKLLPAAPLTQPSLSTHRSDKNVAGKEQEFFKMATH
jgi:hypothetical protein